MPKMKTSSAAKKRFRLSVWHERMVAKFEVAIKVPQEGCAVFRRERPLISRRVQVRITIESSQLLEVDVVRLTHPVLDHPQVRLVYFIRL